MKKQSGKKNYTISWGTHQIEIKEMVEEIEDILLTKLSNLEIKKDFPLLRPPTKGDIVKTAIELYLETLKKNNETNNTPNKWYCPECETWQDRPLTWENEEFINESDGDDIPNYRCNKCISGEEDTGWNCSPRSPQPEKIKGEQQ